MIQIFCTAAASSFDLSGIKTSILSFSCTMMSQYFLIESEKLPI